MANLARSVMERSKVEPMVIDKFVTYLNQCDTTKAEEVSAQPCQDKVSHAEGEVKVEEYLGESYEPKMEEHIVVKEEPITPEIPPLEIGEPELIGEEGEGIEILGETLLYKYGSSTQTCLELLKLDDGTLELILWTNSGEGRKLDIPLHEITQRQLHKIGGDWVNAQKMTYTIQEAYDYVLKVWTRDEEIRQKQRERKEEEIRRIREEVVAVIHRYEFDGKSIMEYVERRNGERELVVWATNGESFTIRLPYDNLGKERFCCMGGDWVNAQKMTYSPARAVEYAITVWKRWDSGERDIVPVVPPLVLNHEEDLEVQRIRRHNLMIKMWLKHYQQTRTSHYNQIYGTSSAPYPVVTYGKREGTRGRQITEQQRRTQEEIGEARRKLREEKLVTFRARNKVQKLKWHLAAEQARQETMDLDRLNK